MYDVLKNSALLAQTKTLETLFDISYSYGEETAACYVKGDKVHTITNNAYRQMADDYAAYLKERLPEGGFVAISVDTCKEWPAMFWGVIRSGHDALLLDATMADSLVSHLMAEAGCRAIITAKWRALDTEITQILAKDLFTAPRCEAFAPVYGDKVALCTSGTTATSRVFVFSGEALCEQVLSSELIFKDNRRIIANENRRVLAFLPMHHVLGFIVNVLWCGFLGYTNVYLKDRTPASILGTAQKTQPHLIVTVPLLANNLCVSLDKKLASQSVVKRAAFRAMKGLSLLLQRIAPQAGLDFARKHLFADILNRILGTQVSCVILGGSHTPKANLRTLNALGYYTVCGFGMTETAVTGVETSLSLSKRLLGSVGKPLSNIQYDVAGGGSEGEMRIRGRSIHTGRLCGGELLAPELTEGGWYGTGDIVRIARDGRVFVKGRVKDLIINESGENVYPDELEDKLGEIAGVEQLAVLGVKQNDGPYETITLVLNVGARMGDRAFLSALGRHVRAVNDSLPAMKRIGRVLVTASPMPVANGIKIKRAALKKLLESGDFAAAELKPGEKDQVIEAPAQTPEAADKALREKVHAFFAEALERNPDSFTDDAHFIDELGGDSLQLLSVALKAEETYGILIPAEEYGRLNCVNDLCALITRMQNGESQAHEPANAERTPITRFEDTPEYHAFAAREEALMASGEGNPYFVCHDSPLLDKSVMDGQEVLNFGSYNYVGMSGRKEVNEAAKRAVDAFGTSASGSRLLAGEKSLHGELEREIAAWKHTEAALVCVGGHSTNVTFVGNFCGENDLIVYDALAHNSIEQGCRLSPAVAKPFPHNDPAALESILRTQRRRFEKVLIVIEGAYSMDGDIADVPAFVRLKKKYGCFLMVDEAHSACVIGRTGGGVDEYFGLKGDDIDIKYGTLSKGLGTCGGYLAGKRCLIEYLRYSLPGFVFSVGMSPALAAASLEAVRLLRRDSSIVERLHRNIRCFADGARARGLDICLAGETAIIPVLVGRDEDAFLLSNELRRRGVFVPPAVFPAVPKNGARLRFCVISEHEPEQIRYALDTLLEAANDLGIDLPAPQKAMTA